MVFEASYISEGFGSEVESVILLREIFKFRGRVLGSTQLANVSGRAAFLAMLPSPT